MSIILSLFALINPRIRGDEALLYALVGIAMDAILVARFLLIK